MMQTVRMQKVLRCCLGKQTRRTGSAHCQLPLCPLAAHAKLRKGRLALPPLLALALFRLMLVRQPLETAKQRDSTAAPLMTAQ